MVMNLAGAINAYKQSGMGSGASAASDTTGAASGVGNFSDMLKGYTKDATQSLKAGEQAAVDGVTGKSDLASVVTAISNAELMMQTVVTIRDKVIAAYQDITKTAI